MTQNNIYSFLSKTLLALMEVKVDGEELSMDDMEPMFVALMKQKNLRFLYAMPKEYIDFEKGFSNADVQDYFFDSCSLGGVTQDGIRRMLYELTEPILTKLTK